MAGSELTCSQIQGGCGCDLMDKILNFDLGLQDLLDSETLGRTPNFDFLFVKTRLKLFISLPFIKHYNTCHCKVLALVHYFVSWAPMYLLIFFSVPFIPENLCYLDVIG